MYSCKARQMFLGILLWWTLSLGCDEGGKKNPKKPSFYRCKSWCDILEVGSNE